VRAAVVWDALQSILAGGACDVLDVGGGTGGFAVPVAAQGHPTQGHPTQGHPTQGHPTQKHRVTVVDPSPDALASLQRRAREVGVDVRAVQGDAAGLLEVVGAGSADLVLCHGVLEHVDDVAPALAALAAVLRPGGMLSLLAAHRNAVVVARGVAGRFAEARHALTDPAGRWGPGDPLPRRFTESGLRELLTEAGLQVREVHGVRVVADLVPGTLVDAEPGAADELLALERLIADLPEFRAVATQLHVLAARPEQG
jgi:SAM-dependent methyltransferase